MIVDGHHLLDGKLGVALGGGEALVSEKLLNGTEVGAFLQHVRAEGVAQGVRMDVGGQAPGNGNSFDDAPDAARGP